MPAGVGLKGIPVFKDDEKDAYGGGLGLGLSPIVSETDLINMKIVPANVERKTSILIKGRFLCPQAFYGS